FLVVPLTSDRVFCALVPARPALRNATTTWWTRSSLKSRPNTSSETDSLLALPVMVSSIVLLLTPCSPDARSRRHPEHRARRREQRSGRARHRREPLRGSACSAPRHP